MKNLFASITLCLILSGSIAQSKYDSKYAYINESGKVMFEVACKWAYKFSNGLARISKYTIVGDKAYYNYGYINTKGEIVIPCDYEQAYDFNSTATFVKKRGATNYILIDKTGKQLSTKEFSTVSYFFEGMCAFYEDDKMGFIDSTGKVTIPAMYTGSPNFQEGLVCVSPFTSKVAAYGFVDKQNKVVIPLKYNQAGFSDFHNGEARMQIAGKVVLINKKNEVVFKPKQTNCSGFYNGLCAVYTKPNRTGWGYINRKNEFVIQPVYTHVDEVIEGSRSIVEKDGKYGVIDTTGKIIIPIKYFNVYGGKSTGFFAVQNSDNQQDKSWLNMDGQPLTTEKVKYLYGAEGGKLIPFTEPENSLSGYLDLEGKLVIKPIYKKVSPFSEGLAPVEYAEKK